MLGLGNNGWGPEAVDLWQCFWRWERRAVGCEITHSCPMELI